MLHPPVPCTVWLELWLVFFSQWIGLDGYSAKDEGQLTTDVEGNMRSTVEHYMAGLLLALALGVDSYEGRRATYDRCIIYRILQISFFRTKK